MSVKTDIDLHMEKIKWFGNFINSIIDKYDRIDVLNSSEKMESIELLSTILNKVNEYYSVSIMMIKNSLIDDNQYTNIMKLENMSNNSDTDTNSDLSNCSVGSDNFLYGDDCDTNFDKLSLNDESSDTDSLYGDGDSSEVKITKDVEVVNKKRVNFMEPEPIIENKNDNSGKSDLKDNFLNENVNIDSILLYKKSNKIRKLSNYLENSYSY